MTEPALTLDPEQRRIVEDTIADHCRVRGWHLHGVNARTQHVHVVVTARQRHPEVVMDQFKAWCTRRLKELERSHRPAERALRQNWWTQGGSKRWLNDEKSFWKRSGTSSTDKGTPRHSRTAPAKDPQA